MTKNLNVQQRNNLLVGNSLAAELPASTDDLRAWVEVSAYSSQSTSRRWIPVSKCLNADRNDQRYELRWCEIEKEYINHWLDADHYIHRETEINDLMSLEALEEELAKYLDDFSLLQVSWETESPW